MTRNMPVPACVCVEAVRNCPGVSTENTESQHGAVVLSATHHEGGGKRGCYPPTTGTIMLDSSSSRALWYHDVSGGVA